MFEFASPWVWLLLPLPWLVRRFLPATTLRNSNALKVPFIEQMERAVGSQGAVSGKATSGKLALALLIWTLLVASAAKPQWLGEPIAQQLQGRDFVLAVDLSESMLERDFSLKGQIINRLQATQMVTGDFIDRRKGDRIGLILFGDQAYYQAPLTHDRGTVKQFLAEAQPGLAGRATAIGDAIGLAVKRFKEHDNQQRVLILLTDGANTAGALQPLAAANLAKDYGVKIYTIGVAGNDRRLGGLGPKISGLLNIPKRNTVDIKTLKHIAEETGGRYFDAGNLDELAEIYATLDELEPVDQDMEYYRPINPLFHWPLVLALFLAISLLLWRQRFLEKVAIYAK